MIGVTNSKIFTSPKEVVNINLSTNQNNSSGLAGAIIYVEQNGETRAITWNGQ
jgi:hypothetical protein